MLAERLGCSGEEPVPEELFGHPADGALLRRVRRAGSGSKSSVRVSPGPTTEEPEGWSKPALSSQATALQDLGGVVWGSGLGRAEGGAGAASLRLRVGALPE